MLEVDRDNQRISAGIKQLAEDPWETIDNYYKVGDLVTGKVSSSRALVRSSDSSTT